MHGHFLVRLARSWLVYLGASLDRDFASPGLLGVRWDGPAGGTTFRDPVAEPRPGSRSRAYVPGPSAGGWPKVALMTQVGAQYDSYGDRPGPCGPVRWKKKMEGHPSRNRSSEYPAWLLGEMKYGESLAPGRLRRHRKRHQRVQGPQALRGRGRRQ